MNLPEAIETLSKEQKDHHSYPTDIIGKAELLGVGAMKGIIAIRCGAISNANEPLPGETED